MASFLVDTHVLLWANSDPGKLSAAARGWLEDRGNRIFVSHATVWELSVKVTIGKLRLPEAFFAALPELGFETLALEDAHFEAYRKLPLIHRDPFDRLLVAQALAEEIPLITCDAEVRKYEGLDCCW